MFFQIIGVSVFSSGSVLGGRRFRFCFWVRLLWSSFLAFFPDGACCLVLWEVFVFGVSLRIGLLVMVVRCSFRSRVWCWGLRAAGILGLLVFDADSVVFGIRVMVGSVFCRCCLF